MILKPSLERLKLDKRMLDINLKNRTVSKADVEKHLKSLPDSAVGAQPLSFNHDFGKRRLQ